MEDSIKLLYHDLKQSENDSIKHEINNKICAVFSNILQQPPSFEYKFDSLKTFGKLDAPDKLFRIITWYYVQSDGSYFYSGVIQLKQPKTGNIKLFPLIDKNSEIENKENSVLSAGKWIGGLYYKILKNKINQTNYYTILCIRYNNLFTTSKLIEILYFDEFDNPVFGAPLFNDNNKTKLRKVFEYSANAAMNLNYNELRKMIIFDHLSASDPRFNGLFEYYGPDFSYDGYQFKNNQWLLITDLDIKSPDDKKNVPQKRIPVSNKIRR
jgi:hypothetical protein